MNTADPPFVLAPPRDNESVMLFRQFALYLRASGPDGVPAADLPIAHGFGRWQYAVQRGDVDKVAPAADDAIADVLRTANGPAIAMLVRAVSDYAATLPTWGETHVNGMYTSRLPFDPPPRTKFTRGTHQLAPARL